MLPLVATIPIASSLFSGLFNSLSAPAPVAKGAGKEFRSELSSQMNSHQATPYDRIGAIHGLIALQQGMGPLQPEIQMSIANQLMNKTVQVVDAGGNSVVGTVTEAAMKNGQMQLTVKGQSYPMTALQAVLNQI